MNYIYQDHFLPTVFSSTSKADFIEVRLLVSEVKHTDGQRDKQT
jgi:hypothetical protein